MKKKLNLLFVWIALLTVSSLAAASQDSFNFSFKDGNVSGLGTLYGTFENSGSWLLTSGNGTFNDGVNSGTISLILNPSGPSYSAISPSGYFVYDDQLFPFFGPSQLVDEDGLLFSFNGVELNLWQTGASPGGGGWAESNGNGDLNGGFTITSTSLQQPPSITILGTSVTVSPGATTANTSSITVTPEGGFEGNIQLSAAITSSPAGAQYPPTLNFGSTNLVTLTSAAAGTAKLTVNTTAASNSAKGPTYRQIPWFPAGSGAMVCLLFFGIPTRWRKWRIGLGILIVFAILNGGLSACGGGGSGGGGGGGGNSGTTAGAYTITVTGAYGSTTTSTTFSLNVL